MMKRARKQCYSIRKLQVGVGSVMLGTILLAITSAQNVQAQDTSSQSSTPSSTPSSTISSTVAPTSSSQQFPLSEAKNTSEVVNTSVVADSLTISENSTPTTKQSKTVNMAYHEDEKNVDGSIDYTTSYTRDKEKKETIVTWAVTVPKNGESWTGPRFVFAFPKGVEVLDDIGSNSGVQAFKNLKFSAFTENGGTSGRLWRADRSKNKKYFEDEWYRHVSWVEPKKVGLSLEQFETIINMYTNLNTGIRGAATFTFKLKVPDTSSVNPYNIPLLAGINKFGFGPSWYRFKGEVPKENIPNPHFPGAAGDGGLTNGEAIITPAPKQSTPQPPTPSEKSKVEAPSNEIKPKPALPMQSTPPATGEQKRQLESIKVLPLVPETSPAIPEQPKPDRPKDELRPAPVLPLVPDVTPPKADQLKPEQPERRIMPAPVLPMNPDTAPVVPEQPKLDKPKTQDELITVPIVPRKPEVDAPENTPKLNRPQLRIPNIELPKDEKPKGMPKPQGELKPIEVLPLRPESAPSTSEKIKAAVPQVGATQAARPHVDSSKVSQSTTMQTSKPAKSTTKHLPDTGEAPSVFPWLGAGLIGLMGVAYIRKNKK
ncbi:YSIRK-type signal peptide-containing protein [Streptococcus ruminantium]|uniref:YSIRK-type signal peptide-containing protein n=1 Tax=Streptococcus ruminantium TaxID=1917441 RepID=A0ABU1B560_9STRE|nr:YSIRK-type signal peptide-containing protein [Streptococcus ruminantium]MDQ8769746.1 YSIRK-type signal peptide-containing protein [Streptococcus ruminantium]MDQ8774484.1 YSIRK-type signal peptide-containing protein [Streptococcus ruminantium]MDQ8794975.1 YSIRK-type signal peptide-containing protein [Streptococcus ruminantium]MDQ8795868.1 YSIRK-type signal peptide-containing protein [Streptococcus ruminantium]MDQ8805233.1 YSIRK-type signal peptide-containing protein [Streptococcus ruminantiu